MSKRVYTIKLNIRAIAESKGITRTKLSRIADLNYQTVNALWQEQASDVMLVTLAKVAHALNVDVSDLYSITYTE